MKFQLVSLRDHSLSRDWTQQELAEFYRVESVLGAAGIAVEMDRGLTDEGDPWFVFCRPQNGDVVIHFARYDSQYLAASGALGQVLRGRNFRELVDAFIARQPLVVPGQNTQNTIVLHPSTLLTALVATALFLLDHQTADASPILVDVNIDGEAPQAPANKFAALVNLLIEPLQPHHQREAILAIGAIVAGIAAISFDAAKDSPTITAAIDLTTIGNVEDHNLAEDDRLQLQNQMPTRKMADAGADSTPQTTSDSDAGAGAALPKFAEVDNATSHDRIEIAMVASRMITSEATHKDTATVPVDLDLAALDLPNLFRPLPSHDHDGARREPTDNKGIAQQSLAAAGGETTATVQIPAEHADLLLQDSLAANITKTFGAASSVHLSIIDAASMPQWSAVEFALSDANAHQPGLTADHTKNDTVTVSAKSDQNTNAASNEDAALSSVEQKAMDAITFFAKTNPDFKIAQLGKDIILFDFEVRPNHQIVFDVHSWALPDGSKVTIIGALPDQYLA